MAKKYTLLVVPRGRGDAKRLEISRWAVILVATLLVSGIGGLFALSIDGLFYRSAYLDSKSLSKKTSIAYKIDPKLEKLKKTLNRMERLASKLTNSLPANSSQKAVGPVANAEWNPNLKTADEEINQFSERVWQSPFGKTTSPALLELSTKELLERADSAEEKLFSLMFTLKQGPMFLTALPSVWPVRGWVTSGFGERRRTHIHKGIDIAAPTGTSIYAPGTGIVTYVGYKMGFGKVVKVSHGFGLETIYGHCSRIFVKEGDQIGRGKTIAAVGNTGYSTGPHLHYEIRVDGLSVNPLRYIANTL